MNNIHQHKARGQRKAYHQRHLERKNKTAKIKNNKINMWEKKR